jgi:hypothetical protein
VLECNEVGVGEHGAEELGVEDAAAAVRAAVEGYVFADLTETRPQQEPREKIGHTPAP